MPINGEEFQGPDHCLERLNAWGLFEGCAYVKGRTRPTNSTPNWLFQCIFHHERPQNRWKLEDRVVREDGEITSKRKRDTTNLRRGCQVQYFLSDKTTNTRL